MKKTDLHYVRSLGAGTHGRVDRYRHLPTNCPLAIKKCVDGRAEAAILSSVHHSNVIQLLGCFQDGSHLWLVMPLCDGNVKQFLDARRPHGCERPLAAQIAADLMRALECVHSHGLVHRDVKPQNLLMRGRNTILADFSLACRPGECRLPQMVTMWYRPPEVLRGDVHYSPGTDMWSAGCVYYELRVNAPLFRQATEDSMLACIRDTLCATTDGADPFFWMDEGERALRDGLLRCGDRWTASCVLRHLQMTG